jgi:hypothetical protein
LPKFSAAKGIFFALAVEWECRQFAKIGLYSLQPFFLGLCSLFRAGMCGYQLCQEKDENEENWFN